jgi:hypothetical protein
MAHSEQQQVVVASRVFLEAPLIDLDSQGLSVCRNTVIDVCREGDPTPSTRGRLSSVDPRADMRPPKRLIGRGTWGIR